MSSPESKAVRLTVAEVREVVGRVSDAVVGQILETGGTRVDLDAAVAWIAGETETLSEEGHPLTGPAARIFEVLTASEAREGGPPDESDAIA
jgi:hypothetical protein